MSAVICIPPLLGWKVDRPDEPFPTCQLSNDIGYVLYSALGSFYVPSCIMVFVYIRIYFAAKARARRGIRKQMTRKKLQANVTTSFTAGSTKGTRPIPHFPTRFSSSDLTQNKSKLIQSRCQMSQSESQLSDSLDSSEQLQQQQEQLLLSSTNPEHHVNNANRLQITKEQMIATIENIDNSGSNENQIPIVTCDLASDVSTSEANDQNHPLI
ncbi:alpha-2C adrenergic receptor-like [Ctenocephalides felis]|uniref:alpha-2C adrenergic receptor-like n=1 Tax=Ctenocephalides felis TaxID=7515 RepID=UPI000E6E4BEB|nr:alpha-2C adrenergic receptor-like [Ctenocephalides felis]